jgi:pilus assembly protein CpaE
MVERAMVKHSTGVHVLARPNQFSQVNHITAAHCASVLSTLQQMYEYVVVDGPNRFDAGGMAVLDLADTNLLVVQLLVPSVRNVHRMLDELRGGGYNLSRFKLVCNRVSRESAYLEVSHVEKTLNMKVEYQIPDDWKTVIGSVNVGVPLLDCAPKSSVRAAFRQMAQSILCPQEAAVENARSGGLLGRIFSGV